MDKRLKKSIEGLKKTTEELKQLMLASEDLSRRQEVLLIASKESLVRQSLMVANMRLRFELLKDRYTCDKVRQ